MASQSVEDFLNTLEPESNKYAESLQDQGLTSTRGNIQFLSRNRLTRINGRFKNCYLIAYFALLHG
jgi:hypothetical protein